MALHIIGRQFFFLSLLYLGIGSEDCTSVFEDGKEVPRKEAYHKDSTRSFGKPGSNKSRSVMKKSCEMTCISNPCQNGETCTETLYGFNCTQGSHGLKDVEELPSCPENWLYYKGYCYSYFSEVLTFVQALMTCGIFEIGSGTAQIVSIHSQQEFEFILSICQSLDCTFTQPWIGLERPDAIMSEDGEMLFKWIDGTPLDYEAWHPGQPDTQDILAAGAYINSEHPKPAWEDSPTFLRKHFVCKGPLAQ